MIFKKDIIDAINDLDHDLTVLSIRVNDLERELHEKNTIKVKRVKAIKSANVAKQPRSKDGKFAKKN